MYVLGLQRAKQRLFRGHGALVATCYKFQAVLETFKFFRFRTSQTIRMPSINPDRFTTRLLCTGVVSLFAPCVRVGRFLLVGFDP
jgi:hypothetical protein